jgi:hypothetical protein
MTVLNMGHLLLSISSNVPSRLRNFAQLTITMIIPFFLRSASALLAVAAMKLTYENLNAKDFSVLSLILFVLAISTAIASPLNRQFWAHNSKVEFQSTTIATILIFILVYFGFSIFFEQLHFNRLYILFILYCSLKIIERYIYGQLIFDYDIKTALPVTCIFVTFESIFCVYQYLSGSNNLAHRILIPTAMTAVVLFSASKYRIYMISIFLGFRNSKNIVNRSVREIFSRVGLKTLMIMTLSTLATMFDRAILMMADSSKQVLVADYLLTLSYTIAIQSFLNIILDVGRKQIYQKGAWLPGAKNYVMKNIAIVVALNLALMASFPLLQLVSIIPVSISAIIWLLLLARAAVNTIIGLAYVDSIQQGRITDMVIPILCVIALNIAFVGTIFFGRDLLAVNLVILCGLMALGAVVTAQFIRRVRDAVND